MLLAGYSVVFFGPHISQTKAENCNPCIRLSPIPETKRKHVLHEPAYKSRHLTCQSTACEPYFRICEYVI